MAHKFSVDEVSLCRRNIQFTVDSPTVDAAFGLRIAEAKAEVALPGYRKGKVPTGLIEKRFGKQIAQQVRDQLINQTLQEAISALEEDMNIIGEPMPENLGEVAKGTDYTFTIGFEIIPQIDVQDYSGVEVVFPEVSSTEEEVSSNIDARLATRRKVVKAAEDAVVETGDNVLVQLTLTSIPAEGEEAEVVAEGMGTMIKVGSETVYVGVDEFISGMSVGGQRSGEVTIGESSRNASLQGNTYTIDATVEEIQRSEIPELNDELAVEMGFESVEDMTSKISAQIVDRKSENLKNNARIELLQKIVASNEFEPPSQLVRQQFQALQQETVMRRAYAGENPNSISLTPEEQSDLMEKAVFAAKASCILNSITRIENIEVTEEDVDAKLAEMAETYGQPVEKIKAQIAVENATDVLKERIMEDKVIGWLLDNAVRLEAPAAESEDA